MVSRMINEKQDDCEVACVDGEKVNRVKTKLTETNTGEIAKLFKALSDDTRIKIAFALTQEKELCVCDLSSIVGCSTATASHHLRLLKNLGLANYRKAGK